MITTTHSFFKFSALFYVLAFFQVATNTIFNVAENQALQNFHYIGMTLNWAMLKDNCPSPLDNRDMVAIAFNKSADVMTL